MKLIDLLVQELPKRGGWPEGVKRLEQDSDGQFFEMESDYCSEFELQKCDSWIDDTVTKAQYEAALAASKPQWDGKFPIQPGTDVEVHFDGDDSRVWTLFRVEYMAGEVVVLRDYRIDGVDAYKQRTLSFRQIRSEADNSFNKNALVKLVDGYDIDHWASLAKERFHKVNELESELIEVRKMLTSFYRSLKEGMMHHKIVTDEE